MSNAEPVSIDETFAALTFLPDRTPHTVEKSEAFARLADYRDGGVFAAYYAGTSEWERHPVGDEIVAVVEGETTLIMLVDDMEQPCLLKGGEFVVVPQSV